MCSLMVVSPLEYPPAQRLEVRHGKQGHHLTPMDREAGWREYIPLVSSGWATARLITELKETMIYMGPRTVLNFVDDDGGLGVAEICGRKTSG